MSASLPYATAGSLPLAAPLRFGRQSAARGGSVQWLLKRNCSLAPRQLLAFYASLCLISSAIAGFSWSHGATLVLPFAVVEMLAVGAALLFYARHAADREIIRLQPGRLVVRHVSGPRVQRVEFAAAWVRVEPQAGDHSLIELSGQGRRMLVGRFVRPELRRQLASELRWALRRWQSLPASAPRPEDLDDVSGLKWQP